MRAWAWVNPREARNAFYILRCDHGDGGFHYKEIIEPIEDEL